jgi:two-component system, sensor histidine kinase
MINDILDYSQIMNGQLRLQSEQFSVWNIIKDVSKLIKFQAKRKGLVFTAENFVSDDNLRRGTPLSNDPNRLKQVILNLLGNALKFTECGHIRISLEDSENHDRYIIKVTDSGIGIRAEDQPRLFRLFGKLDGKMEKSLNKSGVGLGLAISQSLVKIMNKNKIGGEIMVESEYRKGSCFYFPLIFDESTSGDFGENFESELIERRTDEATENFGLIKRDLKAAREIKNLQDACPSQSIQFHKKLTKILVVDDDQINLMVASNFLKNFEEYEFDVAQDGLEALSKITKRAQDQYFYDIILMDCNMPKMDGFEATRIINEMIDNSSIPKLSIIACTANASPLDYEMCFKSGMTDYISKPFSKAQLRAKIQKLQSKTKEN